MTTKELVKLVDARKVVESPIVVHLSEELAELHRGFQDVQFASLTGDKLTIKKGWLGNPAFSRCRLSEVVLNGFEMRGLPALDCDIDKFELQSGPGLILVDCKIQACRIGRLLAKHAVVTNTSFSDVRIEEAQLRRGQFKHCQFERCIFGGRLSKCNFIQCTFKDVDMRSVHFLDSVFQSGEHPKLPEQLDSFACIISKIAAVEDEIKPLLSPEARERFTQMAHILKNDHAISVFGREFFNDYSAIEADNILRCLFNHRLRQN